MHLSEASVGAAVTALADRNRHHLESMTEAERADAIQHWHELAVSVLTAASAAIETEAPVGEAAGVGRAVIVLEDVEAGGVAIYGTFFPELEELGEGELAGTPAQITAFELLQALRDADDADDAGDAP
jgi:hypothetical protein